MKERELEKLGVWSNQVLANAKMVKNLCTTQGSKTDTDGLMLSRGVWKDRPFEEDVVNIGFSPFQQEEPGYAESTR